MKPIEIFFSYAHEDEALMDDVRRQLVLYDRQEIIRKWHDRKILPGQDWEGVIDRKLSLAQIILLFVSPHFIESRYCYEVEMAAALQRHEIGEAVVIPIILRPCTWLDSPIRRLAALPKDGRAITQWPNRDEVTLDVATEIMRIVRELSKSGSVDEETLSREERPEDRNIITQQNIQQQSQQDQVQRQEQSLPTPQIEMLRFTEKTVEIASQGVRTLAVPFRNTSDVAIRNIVAQIEFKNIETPQRQNINYGFWIEADDKRISFQTGDTKHIALVGVKKYQNVTLDSKWTRRYLTSYCEMKPLKNGVWHVEIELIGDGFRQSYPPFRIEASERGVYRLRKQGKEQTATKKTEANIE